MAKNPRKKPERYAGKTEEEWRDWGENFGKWMDKRGREFGEEVSDLGERFGKHMERRSKEWEGERREWWFTTFGFIGPLIGSIFGIILLIVGIYVLNFLNLVLASDFISAVSNFLYVNLYLFFAIFLFTSYNEYFSKRYHRDYWIVSPIATSIGIAIAIWIAIWVLNLINTVPNSHLITSVANFLSVNLLGIFIIFLVLGYVVVVVKKFLIDMLRF